jgi:DNA gyrase subunit A
VQVTGDAEVMLVTNAGTAIRTRVASISVLGRNTQGVKLMGVGEGELLAGLAVVAPEETQDGDEAGELAVDEPDAGPADGDAISDTDDAHPDD